jgi:hypothetical protein
MDDAVHEAHTNVTLGTAIIFFVILSAGAALSALVLVLEMWWHRPHQIKHLRRYNDNSRNKLL